jgi:porphobilinogen synthase
MPGHAQLSIDLLVKEVKEAKSLGIPGIILFGIPEKKDEIGSEGYADDGIVQRALRAIKEKVEGILVITDVCLCEYNHPLRWSRTENFKRHGSPLNKLSLCQGRSRWWRPRMMDGGGSHSSILDGAEDFINTRKIRLKLLWSLPGCCDQPFGDRKSYQMDPANGDEALREVRLDIEEGADLVMVKPALPYLDIIYRVKQAFNIPVAAYNVSGEFALVKAASQLGWVDGEQVMMESLIAIKRAGADFILTYFAKEAAQKLK